MQEIGLDIEQQAIDEAMIELGLQGLNEVTDKIKFHEVVARKRKELKDKFKKFQGLTKNHFTSIIQA